MFKKLFAEAFGTFLLVLVVQLALFTGDSVLAVPVMVALVLGFLVYTIGNQSGCHINPAITVGLWSIKKISNRDAVYYVLSQLLGAAVAVLAMVVAEGGSLYFELIPASNMVLLAEVIGGFVFGFGVAAVVLGKVHSAVSGIVVGGSLLLAICVAVLVGSSGLINPAVALALGQVNFVYVLGSVIGAVLGMNVYQRLIA
jgi:glycerol uptake facilitator-like aquaporin